MFIYFDFYENCDIIYTYTKKGYDIDKFLNSADNVIDFSK